MLKRQVCSPAAEALEGIRYPRVAAVTVLPLVLCSLGGECRRVRLVLGLLMMMMMMMMMMSNQLMTELVFLGCIPSILKVFGWFSRWRSIPRYTNQIDITPSAFKELSSKGHLCEYIMNVNTSRTCCHIRRWWCRALFLYLEVGTCKCTMHALLCMQHPAALGK